MNLSKASYLAAGKMLGLKEWPGAKHNPAVVKMFADTGNDWVNDDETPWCAAFVGSVLASVGVQGTGKLNARSYLDWGDEVDLADARAGDICVFWRGSPDGWQGHVAFYGRMNRGNIVVRGGNQGNTVSDREYAVDRLLSIRRAPEPVKPSKRATRAGKLDLGSLLQLIFTAIGKILKGSRK